MGRVTIDWSDESEPVKAQVSRPAEIGPVEKRSAQPWQWDFDKVFNVVLVGLCCGLIFFSMRNRGDGPNPSPVDGKYALVVEDVENRLELSETQQQIMVSVPLREFCDSEKIEFRKFDKSADLKNEDQVWQGLLTAAKGPFPSLVTGGRRGVKEQRLPEDPDRTIAILRGAF